MSVGRRHAPSPHSHRWRGGIEPASRLSPPSRAGSPVTFRGDIRPFPKRSDVLPCTQCLGYTLVVLSASLELLPSIVRVIANGRGCLFDRG